MHFQINKEQKMKKSIIIGGIIIGILLTGCNGRLFGTGGLIDSAQKNSFVKTHNLRPIKYQEFKSILSGNTLIREPNKKDSQILLLDKRGTNPNSGLSDIAIEIDINKKTVTTTEWGLYAGLSYYPIIGTTMYKIDYYEGHFPRHFFINANKTKFFIITSKYTVEYQIIQGHPEELVKLAKTSNFSHKSIQSTSGLLGGMLLNGVAKVVKNSNNTSTSSSYTPCNWHTGNSCYNIVRQTSATAYLIECTRGLKIGQTNTVCVNDKGKWASGCGFSSMFAYHDDSMSIAANKWCDN